MRYLALISILMFGCGPKIDSGDFSPENERPDAGGPVTSITGTVWAPGQAPGMVAPGEEIPVYNALVQLSLSRPAPIPQQTYCERCVEPVGLFTFTDHRGKFTLDGVRPDTYFISVQKGQFRIEREVTLREGERFAAPQELTTLPSINDPAAGLYIPKIAIAVGSYDHLEDILGKMGIGAVDSAGKYEPSSADGFIDVYSNGASFPGGSTRGTLTDLVSDLNQLLQYHIVFIPCSGSGETSALSSQQNLRNIRDYVDAGGKLYVTDWSGEWSDNVFPTQVTLGPNEDTPASAYDPATDTWNTSLFGDADGTSYDSNNAEVVDPDAFEWLHGQAGPIIEDYNVSVPYDANNFSVEGNWNEIDELTQVQIGMDMEGLPVFDTPRAYIIGGRGMSTPKKPLTVTFEPTGCGRVLYSTYHTTDVTHNGLVPQERLLLYLIMEIGVCQSGPIVD